MKIYILGKIGKLTHEEIIDRHRASIEITHEGNEPVNFNHEACTIWFENNLVQLINELSYMSEAQAVALLPDYNQCEESQLLLLIAMQLRLPIHPANGCIIPHKISFTINM